MKPFQQPEKIVATFREDQSNEWYRIPAASMYVVLFFVFSKLGEYIVWALQHQHVPIEPLWLAAGC